MEQLKKLEPLPTPKRKTFEICLEKEPTENEIYMLQQEATSWGYCKVISLYHIKCNTAKVSNFWTLTFEVDEKDWLFWCGFIAGKKWRIQSDKRESQLKERDKDAAEYFVQI
jgi:hypothetical protein